MGSILAGRISEQPEAKVDTTWRLNLSHHSAPRPAEDNSYHHHHHQLHHDDHHPHQQQQQQQQRPHQLPSFPLPSSSSPSSFAPFMVKYPKMFAPLQFSQFSMPPAAAFAAAAAAAGRLPYQHHQPETASTHNHHHPHHPYHHLPYQPAKVTAAAAGSQPQAVRRERHVMRRKSRETNTTYLWEFLLKLLQVCRIFLIHM